MSLIKFFPVHTSRPFFKLYLILITIVSVYIFILALAQYLQSLQQPKITDLWFVNGTVLPKKIARPAIFPNQLAGDRIVEQLMYVPKGYEEVTSQFKLVYLHLEKVLWDLPNRENIFDNCPVRKCRLASGETSSKLINAVIVKDFHFFYQQPHYDGQIWVLYALESPDSTTRMNLEYIDEFNWTATYRTDSDLVTPYEKWVYFDPNVQQILQTTNYASNKTKQAAWFVSLCYTSNNRLDYALELSKFINVDIYGECGNLQCKRDQCFELLERQYKFYLSFENANCKDYITEKLFNALKHNVLPIVMGAEKADYEKVAPFNSFIHVDDFQGPSHLAGYLNKLDADDALYNTYFRWKGTGSFINTHFWCRLCAMLHLKVRNRYYENINEWWNRNGTCASVTYNYGNVLGEIVSE